MAAPVPLKIAIVGALSALSPLNGVVGWRRKWSDGGERTATTPLRRMGTLQEAL
jgi:hypothetical protein